MKTTILLTFSLFLFSAIGYSQISLDLHNKLSYFEQLEAANGNDSFHSKNDLTNETDIAQPIIYKSRQPGFTNLVTYYYPYAADSVLEKIEYDFDDDPFDTDTITGKPIDSLLPFIKKYNELYAMIRAKYGDSKITGNTRSADLLGDTALIETGNFTRQDKWKNDSVDIYMYIVLSNLSLHSGAVTISPTRRIRLMITDKKRKVTGPDYSKIRKAMFNSPTFDTMQIYVNEFMDLVLEKQYTIARKFLSDSTVVGYDDKGFARFSTNLRNDKWMIIDKGFEFIDNQTYIDFKFKRVTDFNLEPLEILDVVFDARHRIYRIGIGTKPIPTNDHDF